MHRQEGTVSHLVQKIEIRYQIPGLLSPLLRVLQQVPVQVVRTLTVLTLEIIRLAVQDRVQPYQIWDLDWEVCLLLQLYAFGKFAEMIILLGRDSEPLFLYCSP